MRHEYFQTPERFQAEQLSYLTGVIEGIGKGMEERYGAVFYPPKKEEYNGVGYILYAQNGGQHYVRISQSGYSRKSLEVDVNFMENERGEWMFDARDEATNAISIMDHATKPAELSYFHLIVNESGLLRAEDRHSGKDLQRTELLACTEFADTIDLIMKEARVA